MNKTILENVQNREDKSPRIPPIEQPKSIKLKLAYWLTKKKIGKVITPMKVVQARMPDTLSTLSLPQKLVSVEENLSLPKDLRFYIKSFVAALNGCSFCVDIAKAAALGDFETKKYDDLLRYDTSPRFQ